MIKVIFIYLIATFIVIGCFYGCWYLKRSVNYKLSYENMVKATCKVEIQKVLEERGL